MKTKTEITQLKNSVKITEYLARLGHHPQRWVGRQFYYKSIFTNENTASMVVDDTKNVFNDFSSGYRGDLIALIMNFKKCQFFDAIDEIEAMSQTPSFSFNGGAISSPKTEDVASKAQIVALKPFGTTISLQRYSDSRGINQLLASSFLTEVFYLTADKKPYYALGFKNEKGGYAIRNQFFKGCIGEQHYTVFQNDSNDGHLLIFEGFFDYLSYLQLNPEHTETNSLILNSKENFKKSFTVIQEFEVVEYWGDSDRAGEAIYQQLINFDCKVIDKRTVYEGYKDLNDYLIRRS
ncbi:MAG: toprim domain-containing protein [Spirosomaceae bacterium]|jgi:hypothetical protein|nr:toprim domain-containing protein [Spirosomataceae bacterium]